MIWVLNPSSGADLYACPADDVVRAAIKIVGTPG
jgi:hypothetical protein